MLPSKYRGQIQFVSPINDLSAKLKVLSHFALGGMLNAISPIHTLHDDGEVTIES